MVNKRLIIFFVLVSLPIFLLISCQDDQLAEEDATSEVTVSENGLATAAPTEAEMDTAVPQDTGTPNPPLVTTVIVEVDTDEETAVPNATPEPANTHTPIPPTLTPTAAGPGALVGLQMDSQVGILLDEIPEDERDRVTEELLNRPDEYWESLAKQQVLLTYNRLHFRSFFYERLKWQLPLPPQSLWEVELSAEGPRRTTVQNHDYVLIDYTFNSTLLTDQESPAEAEPNLRETGGRWVEPFVLPVDPTQLLQRTDNACLNEGGFPPASFDSENVFLYYDYTCEADSAAQMAAIAAA